MAPSPAEVQIASSCIKHFCLVPGHFGTAPDLLPFVHTATGSCALRVLWVPNLCSRLGEIVLSQVQVISTYTVVSWLTNAVLK